MSIAWVRIYYQLVVCQSGEGPKLKVFNSSQKSETPSIVNISVVRYHTALGVISLERQENVCSDNSLLDNLLTKCGQHCWNAVRFHNTTENTSFSLFYDFSLIIFLYFFFFLSFFPLFPLLPKVEPKDWYCPIPWAKDGVMAPITPACGGNGAPWHAVARGNDSISASTKRASRWQQAG